MVNYEFIADERFRCGSDISDRSGQGGGCQQAAAFLAEFRAYIDTYEQSLPGMPFFFTVENGIVIDV